MRLEHLRVTQVQRSGVFDRALGALEGRLHLSVKLAASQAMVGGPGQLGV